MQDYEVVKELGKGGQGTTHLVKRKNDSAILVIKQILCKFEHVNEAMKEAKTMMKLEHPGEAPAHR